jgi:hypothetical protein
MYTVNKLRRFRSRTLMKGLTLLLLASFFAPMRLVTFLG